MELSKAIDVELKGIQKRFGGNVVVNDFNLQIEQGECISFLGPSGCGKTTTLNMIAGFLEPDEGELLIKGKRMNGVAPNKRDLGMVFQTYSLFPHMTVAENVAYGLKLRKTPKSELQERVRKALDVVRLPNVADRYPKQLSGGQRQRIAIARALVVEPSLLLLDEPLSNLDAKLREELREELKRLHHEIGVTTVFVTHDQEEALYLSDRIVVMNHGKIEQIGTPQDIYHSPASEFVHTFIGKTNALTGTVIDCEGHDLLVQTDAGFAVTVPSRKDNLPVRSRVRVFVRPEKITFSPDPAAQQQTRAGSIEGLLLQTSFLGGFTECEVKVGESVLNVRVQNADILAGLAAGRPVRLSWNPEDVYVFPGEER